MFVGGRRVEVGILVGGRRVGVAVARRVGDSVRVGVEVDLGIVVSFRLGIGVDSKEEEGVCGFVVRTKVDTAT